MRISDWSSDVCSSDRQNHGGRSILGPIGGTVGGVARGAGLRLCHLSCGQFAWPAFVAVAPFHRLQMAPGAMPFRLHLWLFRAEQGLKGSWMRALAWWGHPGLGAGRARGVNSPRIDPAVRRPARDRTSVVLGTSV